MSKEDIAKMEFHNEINVCRKQADYVFDIYREVVGAFERQDWQARGPAISIANAKKAGVFTDLQIKRLEEDWKESIDEATGKGKGTDFGSLQERIEEKIFAIPFNCALRAVSKLAL